MVFSFSELYRSRYSVDKITLLIIINLSIESSDYLIIITNEKFSILLCLLCLKLKCVFTKIIC